MKGLKKYIKKNGSHFTERLALDVTEGRWKSDRIARAAQSNVYYNVTGSTLGDMIYLTDRVCANRPLSKGIKDVLMWVQDYDMSGSAFSIWLTFHKKDDFDFTPYI